jgi:hypothetical protein
MIININIIYRLHHNHEEEDDDDDDDDNNNNDDDHATLSHTFRVPNPHCECCQNISGMK